MPKLNVRANKILEAKALKFKNGEKFSIAFLGDSHIGQVNCANSWYRELLKKIKGKAVYTIIHGGDASDYGDGQLKKYVDITEKVLGYGNVVQDENKIPIFTNVGNHDYKIGKGSSTGVNIKEYNDLIGNDNTIKKLFRNGKGPRIAIILLNTGYNVSGQLPGGKDYKAELDKLEKKMNDIIQLHHTVRFIIDMHIPPRIPNEDKFNSSHVLASEFNDIFRKFLMKHPWRIIAITTHHKHGWVQNAAYHYTFKAITTTKEGKNVTKKYTIPVYLTAQGGHCDFNKKTNAQYSFYKMDFIKSVDHYKINAVYRYNMLKTPSGVYVLSKPILINK